MPEETTIAPEVSSSSGFDKMSSDLEALSGPEDSDVEEVATDEAAQDVPDEAPAEESAEVEEPVAEEEPAAEEEQPVEQAAKPEGEEELPEGVSVRERNGKKEMVLTPARYEKFHGAYRTIRDIEPIFGEALTPALAESRQQAFIGQEMMIGDYMSGDPAMEGRFLNQLAQWSKMAQDQGEVQHSPLRNIASKLPQFLKEIRDSETLEAMAAPIMRGRLDDLYSLALEKNNNDLLLSLQHIDNALFGTYKKREQLAPPDPLAKRDADLTSREQKLKDFEIQRSRAELRQWEDATATSIRSAVSEEIAASLKPVEAAYAKFPTELEGIKDLINRDFQQALKKDSAWQLRLEAATRRAQNAKSPAVRDAVKAELEAAYRAKAKYHFDPANNPKVKEIIRQRAVAMKTQSDANHQRLASGAARREPGSVGTPVPQIRRPAPNGRGGAEAWESAVEEALAQVK